jgi:hypothetical protein
MDLDILLLGDSISMGLDDGSKSFEFQQCRQYLSHLESNLSDSSCNL